jgi:hypothetical protein
MKYFFLSLFFALVVFPSVTAQRIKLLSGSLKGLKGEQSYNIVFTYDSVLVGNNTPEEAYLKEKERLWETKEAGKGAAFRNLWFSDRKRRYEPAFIQNFEKYSDVKLGDENAKYTLVVKTTYTESGWNLGPAATHPGEIAGELLVVESSDRNNVIARIIFDKSYGKTFNGGDFEMTIRIQSAYVQAGRWLGDFFRRKSK